MTEPSNLKTFTFVELLNAREVFVKLSQQEINGVFALKIARILKSLFEYINIFDEKRLELFKKYGQIDENDKLSIPENNDIDFKNDLNMLLNSQINIDIDVSMNVESLSFLNLTAFEILIIEKFIN